MQLRVAGFLLVCAVAAFAQGDRGTITGTVTDPTGAVVPNANIQITSSETAALYQVGSTSTGNYTLANLPAGTYVLTVEAAGFKKFERPGLVVQVSETIRVDAILQVGASTETVTVNAEAPLLKTESGEISHQVDYEAADLLPLFTTNGTGTSTMGNIRDPLTVLNILPGAQQTTDTVLRINGLPSSSQTIMVEGMDATNGMWRQQNQSTQQGADAVQEVSVQTSNFAAEYGGAGGGYLNFTMKSGTNQYHGSAYDYFVNPVLDAGLPFTANCNQENNCPTNPNSGHIKNDIRRNDYGFTLGGPVRIPKLYNGKDKTFFFFNFEQFRQTTITNNGLATVPIPAYRQGNFRWRHSEPDLRSGHQTHCKRRAGGKPISGQRDSHQPDGSRGIVSAELFPRGQHIGRIDDEQLRHPGLFQFPAHHHPVDEDRPDTQFEDEVVRLHFGDGN
jgi:hypothetical protein